MADLINRQEAIGFINATRLLCPNEPRWSDNEVINFLKSRPSAQSDIIYCKDCKWWAVIPNNDSELSDYRVCYALKHCRTKENDFCSRAERRTNEGD